MSSQLGQQIRIIGQRLNLQPGTIGIDTQQLRPIGRERDLLNPIGLDEPEEVRVADGSRGAAARLDDGKGGIGDGSHGDGGGRGGGGGHVDAHGHEPCIAAALCSAIDIEGGGGGEGLGLGEEEGEDCGDGELHFWFNYCFVQRMCSSLI